MAENDKDQTDDYETYVGGRRYDPDTRRLDGAVRVLREVRKKHKREAEQREDSE